MTSANDLKAELEKEAASFALAAAKAEYAEFLDSVKSLDLKAQIVTAVAGVLLSAIVAFASKGAMQSLSLASKVSLVLSMISVAIAFVMAFRVMKVREYSLPVTGLGAKQVADDIRSSISKLDHFDDAERDHRLAGLYTHFIGSWTRATEDLASHANQKKRLMRKAQGAVGVAMFFAAVAVVIQF